MSIKVSEFKILEVKLDEGETYTFYIHEKAALSDVLIGTKKISVKDLKALMDCFTDRYPFAFSESESSEQES